MLGFGDNAFPCLGHDGATRWWMQELGDALQRLAFRLQLIEYFDLRRRQSDSDTPAGIGWALLNNQSTEAEVCRNLSARMHTT